MTTATHPDLTVMRDIAGESLVDVITAAITNQPRSLQKRIGPSQFTPCDRCLGHRLNQTPENDTGRIPWATVEGTGLHGLFEEWFTNDPNPDHASRWLCENRVSVGEVDGTEITGSTDLFDVFTGTVIDFKFPGSRSYAKYKRDGASAEYRNQAHLYGRGWVRAGYPVYNVMILFVQRGAAGFNYHMWSEPYDEHIAVDALERATRISVNIRALTSISEQAAVDYINGLPADPHCYSCPRYPGAPTKPVAENTATLLNL